MTKPSLGRDRPPTTKREPRSCPRCQTLTRHHCRACGVVLCALCLDAQDRCQDCSRSRDDRL